MTEQNPDLIAATREVASAYLRSNQVDLSDIPDVIKEIHDTFASLGKPEAPAQEPLKPAVPIKKSITPDYIVCLEDGKQFKSLKRHLQSHYNLTPEEYREKWGLPHDYPMVAPSYAEQRSALAKKMGLGQQAKAIPAPAPTKKQRKTAA